MSKIVSFENVGQTTVFLPSAGEEQITLSANETIIVNYRDVIAREKKLVKALECSLANAKVLKAAIHKGCLMSGYLPVKELIVTIETALKDLEDANG